MREQARCELCRLPLARRVIRYPTFPDQVVANNEAHDATIEQVVLASFKYDVPVTHRPKATYE